MSVLQPLISALQRAGGERLVLRSGERPHVLVNEQRLDIGTAVLSVKALDALSEQILSRQGRQELASAGTVVESVPAGISDAPLTARAERVDDVFCIELRREAVPEPAAPTVAEAVPAPEAVPVAETPAAGDAVPPSVAPPEAGFEADWEMDVAIPDEPAMLEPALIAASIAAPAPVAAPPVAPIPQEPVLIREASRPRRGSSAGLAHWIVEAAQCGAATLYLRAGQPPAMRVQERLEPLTPEPLDASLFVGMSAASGPGDGWKAGNAGEWVREYPSIGVVTCYVFEDNTGPGLVLHLSRQHSAAALQKHVPRQVRRVCEADEGLVIVSAPGEADVLSMLTVVADLSARKRAGFTIALEPANGLGYGLSGPFVSERKIAGAGEEFAAAIRRATQERPDILVIAPRESSLVAEEAIRSASPGRLVILGIVAPTAPRALEALLSLVSSDREPQLRRLLAASYRVGFSYRALRRHGGGRTIVEDVLIGTSDVRTRLERADFAGLEKLQRTGADGMRTMDDALARAASRGDITLRQAANHAGDRADLISLVRKQARQRRMAARGADADRRPGPMRALTIA